MVSQGLLDVEIIHEYFNNHTYFGGGGAIMTHKRSCLKRIPKKVSLIEGITILVFLRSLCISQQLCIKQFTVANNAEEYITGY